MEPLNRLVSVEGPVVQDSARATAQTAFGYGLAAWSHNDYASAANYALQAIQTFGRDPAFYNLLGASYYYLGRLHEAAAAYRQAITVEPSYASSYSNLCLTLTDLGQLAEAEAFGWQAIQLDPQHADSYCNLGNILARQGRALEAKNCFLEARKLSPENLTVKRNLGHVYKELGQFAEARRTYEEVLVRNPRDGQIYEKLAQMRRFSATDLPQCCALEAILMDRTLPTIDRKCLHFALGKMYEDIGRYDSSFEHYRRANEMSRLPFNRSEHERFIDQLIAYFSPQRFARRAGCGSDSKQPVFVVGMFRSGTTLVEQILASHAQVFGAGELLDIPQLVNDLRAPGSSRDFPMCLDKIEDAELLRFAENYLARRRRDGGDVQRFVDKMPKNFLSLGLIAFLFPQARVIHCRRDPRDVGVSCYASNFSSCPEYSHDLGDIGFFFRQYRRLMDHWNQVLPLPILEVNYEQLVQDQIGVTRRMLEFCGLPWEARCIQFHQTERAVTTASDWQVRQPLFASSLGRWKKFERHLGPLLEELRFTDAVRMD